MHNSNRTVETKLWIYTVYTLWQFNNVTARNLKLAQSKLSEFPRKKKVIFHGLLRRRGRRGRHGRGGKDLRISWESAPVSESSVAVESPL